jgi:hypothetical protein
MAQINNANLTAELEELVNASFGTALDTDQLLNIVNKYITNPAERLARGVGIVTGVYKRFGEFDKIEAKSEVVTGAMWSDGTPTLTNPVALTEQPATTYYRNIGKVNSGPTEFAVAYGDVSGSAEEKSIYAQYRSILLSPDQNLFTIAGSTVEQIAVINLSRNRYREKVDPGNWQITKGGTWIDDSGKTLDDSEGKSGRVFDIVNGTIGGTPGSTIVGKFYKNLGIFVFRTDAGPFNSVSSLAAAQTAVTTSFEFEARRTETITTKHFFVRATNREFNYSNNPTFVKPDGSVLYSTFRSDPKVFITTIGLFNEANEMVAVAKTSRPIPKSFDKEVLVRVKIDF